jgi:tetratricopeptide (TPR) repeat protein
MSAISQHTTLVTTKKPTELSPLEGAIMDACNSLHEAMALDDADLTARLVAELDALLDRYEASDAEDHPNPKWAVPHHRALAMSAAGNVEGAVVYEEVALEHADNKRRLEISHGNLAERYLRLERYDEALAHFLAAQEVAPNSTPIMLTGAQALYFTGHAQAADAIFRAFLARPDLLRPHTELTAYLDYETRLRELRAALPSLDALMTRWEEVSRG